MKKIKIKTEKRREEQKNRKVEVKGIGRKDRWRKKKRNNLKDKQN